MTKHRTMGRPTGKFERLLKTYDRRPGNIKPGRCILIVCEGAETEPNYFQELKNFLKISLVEVQIEKRAGAPINLIEKAERLVARRVDEARLQKSNINPYEEVWCVFDVENPNNNPTFKDAISRAKGCNFELAVSNPAFEYWYVLHFFLTSKPFRDGNEIKTYLRTQCIPGYDEATSVFMKIYKQTHQAINNSKNILKNHLDVGKQFPNPSTYVHLLVEELIEMSPSGREHLLQRPL